MDLANPLDLMDTLQVWDMQLLDMVTLLENSGRGCNGPMR